jgi:hypothetical protein
MGAKERKGGFLPQRTQRNTEREESDRTRNAKGIRNQQNFRIVSDYMQNQDPTQTPISENTAKQNATRKFTKDEIIAAIKERAAELGRAPKRAELMRIYPVSPSGIDRQFGSYRNALRECGLEREGCGVPVSLDNLFHDWAQIVRDMKKVPTVMEYGQRSSYSHSTLRQRYGSWNLVPSGMVQYLREHSLEQEWADVLEIGEAFCRALPRKGVRPRPPAELLAKTKILTDRPVYGATLIEGTMGFAPVNEMGVVYLFGGMARRLGFIVLWVGPAFPDCEAFREVEPHRWQRVRIEFEFESRNFLRHFHDPAGCDLIVCWENNWPECPLEVVELKKALSLQQVAIRELELGDRRDLLIG